MRNCEICERCGRAHVAVEVDRRRAGEERRLHAAADRSISRIPIPESRERAGAGAKLGSRQSAAGGAAQAAMLVNLIKTDHRERDDWEDTDEATKAADLLAPGIEVDPNGLLRGLTHEETGNRAARPGHRAREADINTDLRATELAASRLADPAEKESRRSWPKGAAFPKRCSTWPGSTQIKLRVRLSRSARSGHRRSGRGLEVQRAGIAVGRGERQAEPLPRRPGDRAADLLPARPRLFQLPDPSPRRRPASHPAVRARI